MEKGNISKVAKEIHVSQPAISMMLKRLEQDVGVPLYTVVGRNITTTDAGLTLLEYAEAILSLEAQVYRAMEEFQEGNKGRIIVGTSPVLGTYLLPRIILSFNQNHPNIAVHLEMFADQDIENLVLSGSIDIGITITPPGNHFSLRIRKICDDQLVGIRSSLPVDSKMVLVPSDIPLSILEDLTDQTETIFSTEAVKQFVIEGMGYGIVLRSAVELEVSCGKLKFWKEYDPTFLTINVITRPAERLSKSVWYFLKQLSDN